MPMNTTVLPQNLDTQNAIWPLRDPCAIHSTIKKGARSLAGVLNPTKEKQCLIKQWAMNHHTGNPSAPLGPQKVQHAVGRKA